MTQLISINESKSKIKVEVGILPLFYHMALGLGRVSALLLWLIEITSWISGKNIDIDSKLHGRLGHHHAQTIF